MKNGLSLMLETTFASVANSIIVAGEDVYVAGSMIGADGLPRATYWKNGTPINLNANYSVANAIVVHGNDLIIAGTISYDSAAYWKNGIVKYLGQGHANAIAVKD